MSLWKPFLAMTITAYVIALGCAVAIALGIFGVIHLSAGLWLLVSLVEAIAIMSCFICTWMLVPELKERGERQ